MKKTVVLFVLGIASIAVAQNQESRPSLKDAWSSWKRGDIDVAEQTASKHAAENEGRHLLTLCSSVKGKYAEAREYYSLIDSTYETNEELDQAVLHAMLHQRQCHDALQHARQRKMDKKLLSALEARARRPIRVTLEGITKVQFADHPLTPYFPAFTAKINGQQTVVHLDTGGTWLIMGPKRAEKLGIELQDVGEGFHGIKKVKLQGGVAESLVLGDAVLENVPVVGMPSLVGGQNFIIIGTNILQQFHSTLDYATGKLVLSPRGNKELTLRHMTVHKTPTTEVPFFMWGDHYMFVRGRFGKREDLNFFVDSGLVALDSSSGKLRQACFVTTTEQYRKWGVSDDKASKQFFETELPLSVGPLEQKNQYFTTSPKIFAGNLGGIHIDGLISHAFLKEYVWTLDFDHMQFVFSNPPTDL